MAGANDDVDGVDVELHGLDSLPIPTPPICFPCLL
jgi:hypothetical protein